VWRAGGFLDGPAFTKLVIEDLTAPKQSFVPPFDVDAAQVFSTPGDYSFTVPCPATITATTTGASGGSVNCGRRR
jgi:hypothetical protein